jgi:hypothetical protein
MMTVTMLLTGNEWHRVDSAANKLWPGERLSRAEISRRFTLAGTQALLAMQPAEQARAQQSFQETMTAADTRLQLGKYR